MAGVVLFRGPIDEGKSLLRIVNGGSFELRHVVWGRWRAAGCHAANAVAYFPKSPRNFQRLASQFRAAPGNLPRSVKADRGNFLCVLSDT